MRAAWQDLEDEGKAARLLDDATYRRLEEEHNSPDVEE
jgi:hypothetical protein